MERVCHIKMNAFRNKKIIKQNQYCKKNKYYPDKLYKYFFIFLHLKSCLFHSSSVCIT